MAYRKHIQDSSEVLSHYSVYKESRHSEQLVTYKACARNNPNAHFLIRREAFNKSGANFARFESLVQAQKQGVVLATRVFLEETPTTMQLYSVEPLFTSATESLYSIIQTNSLSQTQKRRIFQNLWSQRPADAAFRQGLPRWARPQCPCPE